jgi:hypothetical protein
MSMDTATISALDEKEKEATGGWLPEGPWPKTPITTAGRNSSTHQTSLSSIVVHWHHAVILTSVLLAIPRLKPPADILGDR